VTLELGSNIN